MPLCLKIQMFLCYAPAFNTCFYVWLCDQQVAEKNKDVQLTDFVESEFLTEQVILDVLCLSWVGKVSIRHGFDVLLLPFQVEAIKKISEYVAQLRRVGKGHGRNQWSNIIVIFTLSYIVIFVYFNMALLYLLWFFCFLKLSCFLSIPGVWHFDQALLHGDGAVDAIAA